MRRIKYGSWISWQALGSHGWFPKSDTHGSYGGVKTLSDTRKNNKLRNAARGQQCLVRLPGCDGGGETSILAHYRLAGYSGIGLKPPDIMGAFCCGNCHDAIDFRRNVEGYSREEIRLAHAEGVMRTQVLVDNS